MPTVNRRTLPSSALQPKAARQHAARLEDIGEEASHYLEQSKADNTKRAYAADWADFTAWCEKYRRHSLPASPDTVAYYLADRSQELKTSTLQRRLATISEAHRTAGLVSPTKAAQVKLVWAGIRREKGVAQAHKKPALTKHIRAMVEHLPATTLGVRDRALILLGFAGAMRRSELVGLDVTDVAMTDEGLVVMIRKSKTDQTGVGRKIGVPFGDHVETCPVRAVLAWIDEADVEEGPLFRAVNKHGHVSDSRLTDKAVANVVQRSLKAAGKSARGYAAHSFRAGFITQAAMAGVSERAIQDQSGHKSLAVMRRYIRDGSLCRSTSRSQLLVGSSHTESGANCLRGMRLYGHPRTRRLGVRIPSSFAGRRGRTGGPGAAFPVGDRDRTADSVPGVGGDRRDSVANHATAVPMNLNDAKRRAADLGLEIRYPRRTGEVLFIDPVTSERVRQNARRKDATRKVERLLRRSAGVRPQLPAHRTAPRQAEVKPRRVGTGEVERREPPNRPAFRPRVPTHNPSHHS